ncbi:MAG TPA: hypothetical protein VGR26_17980 [Acidimicrobiales bacterium]|nr:hypothetical protein [Acidimicrobiales bacterium]
MASAADVVAVANREVGVVERPTNRTKYGAWYGLDAQPWCAISSGHPPGDEDPASDQWKVMRGLRRGP